MSADPPSERRRPDRVIVLPEQRILFVPVPKTGCTTLKLRLAALAGLPPDRFARSREADVTQDLAVHDMGLWQAEHRWAELPEERQAALLEDHDWLRFSVVREPGARLWSAWQSKLLLQERRFARRFAECRWFPHRIDSVAQVVERFRGFVHALDAAGQEAPRDNHWAPQAELLRGYRLGYVGRVEDLDAVVARVEEHLGAGATLPTVDRARNVSPIRYHPGVYDEATATIVNRRYAADFADFGYPPLTGGAEPPEEWRTATAAVLPSVAELVARNRRISELLDMLREAEGRELRLERRLARAERSDIP